MLSSDKSFDILTIFFYNGILCTVRTNVSRISYDFAICKIPHPICTLSKYHWFAAQVGHILCNKNKIKYLPKFSSFKASFISKKYFIKFNILFSLWYYCKISDLFSFSKILFTITPYLEHPSISQKKYAIKSMLFSISMRKTALI